MNSKLENTDIDIDTLFNKDATIYINNNVLSQFNKVAINLNQRSIFEEPHIKQGVILGYIDSNNTVISVAYPTLFSFYESEEELIQKISKIKNSVEFTQFDYIPLGLYFITDDVCLHKSQLNTIAKFRSYVNQSLIAFYSPTTFELSLKRLSDEFVKLYSDSEVNNHKEFLIDIFNRHYTSNILVDLNYIISNDMYTNFSVFNDTDKIKLLSNTNTEVNSNKFLSKKLANLNDTCGKLIEEQEKYIYYYKNKKNYSEDKVKEYEENVIKKVGEFNNFEKMFMGIYIQNIKSDLDNINQHFYEERLFNN